MGLFDFGKKKEESIQEAKKMVEGKEWTLKILGSGCAKCNQLEDATKEACRMLEIQPEILHITDFKEIGAYQVMSTPALVINEKVVSYGKVLKPLEVIQLFTKLRKFHNS